MPGRERHLEASVAAVLWEVERRTGQTYLRMRLRGTYLGVSGSTRGSEHQLAEI